MQTLITLLTQQGKTISTCESFTGGLFAAKLTSVPGASRVYLGSVVAYCANAKIELVHVDVALIDTYGTISPQAVKAMAEHTRTLFKSDVAIAFSGNAGPQALEGKPAGLWYGAIADQDQTLVFGGLSNLSRNELREAACQLGEKNLLDWLRNPSSHHINR